MPHKSLPTGRLTGRHPDYLRKGVFPLNRTTIADIYANSGAMGGRQLTVAGWVRSLRDMKTFGFVTLNDGSCFNNLQVVMDRGTLANYDEIAKQNVGAALIISGELVLTPDAKQPFELKAAEIAVEGTSAPDYPLQKKRHCVEFLRTIQHLRPRTNLFSAAFRVRSVAAYAIHKFFQERGFVYVHTPIITASDCEGAGEMFRVTTLDLENVPRTEDGTVDYTQDFFGKPANLTVSGQLQGGELRHGLRRCLHLRPHLPRGELQHPAPRRRVLDDRAGDRLRRPEGRHGPGRGHDQVCHQPMSWSTAPTRWTSSTPLWTRACRNGCSTSPPPTSAG